MKIKPWQVIGCGWLFALLPPLLLLWNSAAAWLVCPYALCSMFLRQAQHPYDSLAVADIFDLLVAAAQFPLMGWLLASALKKTGARKLVVRMLIWHCLAMGAAVLLAEFRNHVWGF
jgi:hypothetical protein